MEGSDKRMWVIFFEDRPRMKTRMAGDDQGTNGVGSGQGGSRGAMNFVLEKRARVTMGCKVG